MGRKSQMNTTGKTPEEWAALRETEEADQRQRIDQLRARWEREKTVVSLSIQIKEG